MCGLNLEQQVASNDVDDEAVDGDLKSIAGLCVPPFDGSV